MILILSKQELPIAVNGLVASVTAMVNSNGQMEQDTKDNGKIIELMEKVNLHILMETFTREIG